MTPGIAGFWFQRLSAESSARAARAASPDAYDSAPLQDSGLIWNARRFGVCPGRRDRAEQGEDRSGQDASEEGHSRSIPQAPKLARRSR